MKPIPCKICGKETYMKWTELCSRCWEIDSRLDSVLSIQELAYFNQKIGDLIKKKTDNNTKGKENE